MENTVFTHIEFIKKKDFKNKETTVVAHNHYFYEMTYVLQGKLCTDMNGKHYECEPNTIIIVPPTNLHSHSSENDYKVIYMGFYYNGLYGPLTQRIFKDENGIILKLLNNMLNEYNNTDYHYESICSELQKLFIFNILRQQDSNRLSNNDAILKHAIAYMQNHYYEDIDMRELAESLGYSYHHFRHIFKENFDVPPKQFLLNQRIQYALRLLRNTDQSISEIAKSCGFASTVRFISAFKSIFKISPMQYRNSDTVNLDVSVFFKENKFVYSINDKILPLK